MQAIPVKSKKTEPPAILLFPSRPDVGHLKKAINVPKHPTTPRTTLLFKNNRYSPFATGWMGRPSEKLVECEISSSLPSAKVKNSCYLETCHCSGGSEFLLQEVNDIQDSDIAEELTGEIMDHNDSY